MTVTIIQPLAIGPSYEMQNFGAAFGPAALILNFAGNIEDFVAPTNGEIFGYSMTTNEVLTAGNFEIAGRVGGAALPTLHTVVAATGSDAFFRETDPGRFFQGGFRLGMELRSNAAMLPITVDLFLVMYLVLNRGVSTDEGI